MCVLIKNFFFFFFFVCQVMLDRVKSNKKIRIITNRVVNKWIGNKNKLSGVQVSDPKTPTITENIPCETGFIAIGHKPNTRFLNNQVRSKNYIYYYYWGTDNTTYAYYQSTWSSCCLCLVYVCMSMSVSRGGGWGLQIDLDSQGYIKSRSGSTMTNIPGLFACGDASDPLYK